MDNKYYICHYCCDYMTKNRKDMKKHFQRKNNCKCLSLFSYDEAKLLTLSKTFIFLFDPSKLNISELNYIINNYTKEMNLVNNDFIQNNYINKNISNDIINNDKTNNNYNDYYENEYEDEDDSNNQNDNEYDENNIKNKKKHIINDKNKEENEAFDKLYFNYDTKKYICPKCDSEYRSKYTLIRHFSNKKMCEHKQKVKELINYSTVISEEKNNKLNKEKEKQSQHIVQNIGNIGNVNIQNINNNNNTQNNTYNFKMNDFVHDSYDLTHIKDSFYEQKDFFIYPNLLKMIMENKKNQNIFFANNEAIIYTDNEINKMSSDKAGYLVLDKLSQSFDEIFSKQDAETKEYYKFINKYYFVVKGHYKHDTIYKEYDVNTRQFYYTANSNMFRSRDKYLSKIVSTTNNFDNDMRKKLNSDCLDIKNIPLVNPNIEDFASVRMRYRDLKDKNY